MPNFSQVKRSIVFSAITVLVLYLLIYLTACIKVNSKIVNYDYFVDLGILIILMQGAVFLPLLWFVWRIHQYQPITISDQALKKFAQTNVPYVLAPIILEILVNAVNVQLPIPREVISRIGNYLTMLAFAYMLFRGEFAIYLFLKEKLAPSRVTE